MSTARAYPTATLLGNGQVLVTGGENPAVVASAELYDPASNSWSPAGTMSDARTEHTATLLGNGKVLVAGGGTDTYPYTLSSAELYVPDDAAPTITAQPSDQAVTAGDTASFTAAADGYPAPTVQWQVSTDGGASFTDLPGATAPTLSFVPTSVADTGNLYRAVFSNSAGSATSVAAALTVSPAAADHLLLSAPAGASAEVPFDLVVTVQDAYGNTVTDYAGTVTFSTDDPDGSVPPDYTFTTDDAGTHTFVGGVTLYADSSRVTATDTQMDSLTGSIIVPLG
jgi:hypothetical protein